MLKPLLLGKDPLQLSRLWQRMYRTTYYAGRMGVVLSAISGVEMALWDIKGKALDTPVYQLLGGQAHDHLPAYASLMPYRQPEVVAKACAAVLEQGFTVVKLHEVSVEAVAAARKALGDDVKLLLDVNCAWDVPDAIEMGNRFRQYDLYWYEEPIFPADNYDGLAEVRERVDMPIACGENEYTVHSFKRLIARQAADVLQPSVFKLGGILQEKKVFTLAEVGAQVVVPHCFAVGPAMAATVQVSFSEPGAKYIETLVEELAEPIYRQPLAPVDGYWMPPQAPGLGIELDEKVLAKYLVS
jgi:D-arabinonate dehydratase/D-galactarolactone cycloisomerase